MLRSKAVINPNKYPCLVKKKKVAVTGPNQWLKSVPTPFPGLYKQIAEAQLVIPLGDTTAASFVLKF